MKMLLDVIMDNVGVLITGVITGVISTGIVVWITSVYQTFKSRHSEYSGLWEQLIFPYNDENYEEVPRKRDFYDMQHKKMRNTDKLVINIFGTIQRDYPQRSKEWDINGYLDGDVLTILYQSKAGQKSRGCIYLILYKDYEFRGFYLEEHKDGTIDKTPLILRKLKDKSEGYDFSKRNETF